MKTLFFLLLFVSFAAYGQDLPMFELTKEGIKPVVLEFPNKNAEELYKKSLKWVKDVYKNPSEVLKNDTPNEKIRIEGYKQNIIHIVSIGKYYYNAIYTLEIDFKDNKTRLTLSFNKFTRTKSNSLYLSDFHKDNGEIRKMYAPAKADLENYMNKLKSAYYNYVLSDKKDDW